jgi:hypothetical protein
MNQIDHPMRQIAGEKRSVVRTPVLTQPARHKNLGVAVGEGQLYIGIGLVVAQQDVETRLALLDEVVFQRQRLSLVLYQDVVHIDGFAHERAGLGVGLGFSEEIGAYPGAKILGFSDVNNFALGIAVQIHPWPGGQGAHLFLQIHE